MFGLNFQNFNISSILIDGIRILAIVLFYTWWIPVLIFAFLSWQNKRKRRWVSGQKYNLLLIQVPKNNEKTPIAAEMMFASLHGIFKSAKRRFWEGSLQEYISFEIASVEGKIQFYAFLPSHLKDFVEGQIYAQYPTAEIKEVPDYLPSEIKNGKGIASSELTLTNTDFQPIRTFLNFEVDPLAGITSTLSRLGEEKKEEEIGIQILVKPSEETWQKNALSYIEAIRAGGQPQLKLSPLDLISGLGKVLANLIHSFLTPVESQGRPTSSFPPKLSPTQEASLKGIEEKASKLPFSVKIRLLYLAKEPEVAKMKLQSVIGAFKQFSGANSFASTNIVENKEALRLYKSRYFDNKGYVLNIEELASLFHLPNISVETPNIFWTGFKKGEPPANLPIEEEVPSRDLCPFASTNFRHLQRNFGIKTDDRRRHIYIIGKTGTGKTTMMENMIIEDIKTDKGVAVVDPHGDFVDKLLNFIPSGRLNDVILFDPADREHPVAFNPLENVDPDQQGLVVSGIISIFQKIWAYTWGPRLEHILRNTLAALIEYPNSTMLGINRMFTDKKFRKKVVKKVTDVETKRFWTQEFPTYEQNERFKIEAIAPIQNKVGQFLASPTIRNIVGQPHSTIDIRKVMDEGKILLVKLAQGAIGEDNSSLLGAMIITKIQLAAMSRVTVPEEERKDFYLYVDEFQNFATPSFAKILSEARKYRLNLILANQYIAQMPDEVREAVFGNIGTLVNFRVGAADATFLAKELEPVFEANDVVNLDKYNIYLKISIDGVTCPAFSAQTLPPPEGKEGNREKIITLSRERFSRSRDFVEKKIVEWMKIEFEEEGEEKAEEEVQEEVAELQTSSERVKFEEILEESIKEVTGKKEEARSEKLEEKVKKLQEKFKKEEKEEPKPPAIKEIRPEKTNFDLKEGEIVKIKK